MLDTMCGYYCGKLYEYFLYFGNVEVFDCPSLSFPRHENRGYDQNRGKGYKPSHSKLNTCT